MPVTRTRILKFITRKLQELIKQKFIRTIIIGI